MSNTHELNRAEVERYADQYYSVMLLDLEERLKEKPGFGGWNEWLAANEHGKLDADRTPEEKAGYLIALAGCIQDFLENEVGVTFTPAEVR